MSLVIEGTALAVLGVYCREGLQRICCSHCPCIAPSPGLRTRQGSQTISAETTNRDEFEALIRFLAAVPIFQKQLPKADLPIVARALRRRTWEPGRRVVEQGEVGKEFFIIRAGQASVVVTDPSTGKTDVRAKLFHGDYFGGHTLTERRPNVASVLAHGPKALETLSLSRHDFERVGLHKKLKFPARPAIYEGRQIYDGQRTAGESTPGPAADGGEAPGPPVSDMDVESICRAVQDNPNMRARGDMNSEMVREMAATARRRLVRCGDILLKGGELGHEFFVVSAGSFEVLPANSTGSHRSVEARLASSTIHERLARKQEFIARVLRREASGVTSTDTAASMRRGRSSTAAIPALFSGGSFAFRWSDPPACPTRRHSSSSLQRHFDSAVPPSPRGSSLNADAPTGRSWCRSVSEGMFSRFRVGDAVERVVAGDVLVKEVGHVLSVIEQGEDGQVLVEFPSAASPVTERVRHLRPVEAPQPVTTRAVGDCIGELCLLYNVRQVAMFRAREDSEVYAIEHNAFKRCFGRESAQYADVRRLLDEVHMLTPLLRAERAELARNSTGVLTFKPGEMVLCKGEVPQDILWYVVEQGTGIVRRDIVDFEEVQDDVVQSNLRRASHFGEYQAFHRLAASTISVQAGPTGMTCVVFDAEIIRKVSSLELDERGNVVSDRYVPVVPKVDSMSTVSLDDVTVEAVLGEGGFGAVFLARHHGKEYALKRMSKGYIVEQDMKKQICAERDILSMLDSTFIIRMFRSFRDAQYLYMVIEIATGGHLYTLMCDRPDVFLYDQPRGSATMFYVACVVCAIEHCHERNIAYRDLKPENILLDAHGYAKLCDLGFARFVLGKTNTMVGTPEYMSPEMIDAPHAHDGGVDWWALGVLTFELLTLQVPFAGPDTDDVMLKLLSIRRAQDAGVPEKLLPQGLILAKDFVRKLCLVDPRRRLGHQGDGLAVRKHPFFTYGRFDFADLLARRTKSPHASAKIIVDRYLPAACTVSSLNVAEETPALYLEYVDDGTSWDDSF